jgi:hypothetical protein
LTTLTAAEFRALKPAKTNKYRAVATTLDGIRFASKREANYYAELKRRADLGEVYEVQLQPPLILSCGTQVIGTYRGDFQFYDATLKRMRLVDVKGKDTPLSAWKRKHVKAQYGIEVEIVR